MTKGRQDSRTYVEIVESLKSERTRQGDGIRFIVEFDGTRKPRFWVEFVTSSSELSVYPSKEEITDFIPDTYKAEMFDDLGELLPNPRSGHYNWYEFVQEIGNNIQSLAWIGGRGFEYKSLQKEY